jgi:SAM-dependent methyltransferase
MDVPDTWAAGSAYEDFMGRWSRQLARRFVRWLAIPDDAHWLDVGCGTGALTSAICSLARPASVLGCDPAEPFVEYARSHTRDAHASFRVAGVGALPGRADRYGCVASLLALNFFPNPAAAVREMRALAADHATVAACVWDYADGMKFLRRFWDAATALDPAARALDEGGRFPLCRPDALVETFCGAGLSDVDCAALEIPTTFASFDDYWRPLLGGTGPAPAYVAALGREQRDALARRLADDLDVRPERPTVLTARAWAVRGAAR